MTRRPIVFGSQHTSYTTKLNYEQCKYRLYLMGDKEANVDKVVIFPPMLRGLVLHKAMELWFTEHREAPLSELVDASLEPSREEVNWGRKRVVWYPPYEEAEFLSALGEELGRFYRSLKHLHLPQYEEVRCEWEVSRPFQGVQFVSHIDIAFRLPSGRWIVGDLKTGKYDLSSEQFLLYNWVVNGFLRYPHPFFVFGWTGEHLYKKVVQHNLNYASPTLMRLLWEMVEMHAHLSSAQEQIEMGVNPAKVLRPNTKHFTCHEHRCSFWKLCPYGVRKYTQEVSDDTDNGDMGN